MTNDQNDQNPIIRISTMESAISGTFARAQNRIGDDQNHLRLRPSRAESGLPQRLDPLIPLSMAPSPELSCLDDADLRTVAFYLIQRKAHSL
jgi:hypothetical protein